MDQVIDGRTVLTGTYMITESLVDYNKKQTDSTKRYKNYYYNTVIITFTSLVPGDSLGVSGLVGSVVCSLSTLSATIKGTVVDKDMRPVASANIVLKDHFSGYVIAMTSTGADGSFSVPNLESGLTFDVIAKSVDGGLQGSILAFNLPCNLPQDSLRAQVTLEQIQLLAVDDVAPYIISVTTGGNILYDNADVTATGGTLAIDYTFSEPIKQTPFTTLGAGYKGLVDNIHVTHLGFKKSAADLLPAPSIAWSANNTVLTVTILGLVGSSKYHLDFGDTATVKANLTDLVGNALRNNLLLTDDIEGLSFSTAGASTVPGAPSLKRRIMPATPFVPLDYSGGLVLLEWDNVPEARSYNVYQSVNGGSFDTVATNVQFTQYQATTGALIRGSLNDPLGAGNVRYQVTGVSKDLVEGTPSGVVTVTDSVKPTLVLYPAPTAAPGTNNWVFELGFSEPLTQSAAEAAASYTFANTGGVTYTINQIIYVGYVAANTDWEVLMYVTSTASPIGTGCTITVGALVTDLAGNGIDNAANTTAPY